MPMTALVRWLAAAFAGVVAVQAAQAAHASHSPYIRGRYIVQYQDDFDPNAVLDEITTKHKVDVRQKLHFKLFKGVDLHFDDTAGSTLAEIRAMSVVKNVWQSRLLTMPKTVGWPGSGDMGNEAVKRGVEHDHHSPDDYSPHVMTQVNLLRDAGYVGKGFKLALIDSGIDYKHPALGGGFGPGYLVSFGRDLVGDDYNGTNTPMPDGDPMDTCIGHGTHVAGIIAAQPDKNPYGIIGAATGINLGAYRIGGCDGLVDFGMVIAAYHSAYEDGADVIHASIGQADGWPEDLWAAAVSTIVAHGVPCTLAAGNDGQRGLFSASDAADAVGAAAVGSVDNVLSPSFQINATYSVKGSKPISFGFSPGRPNNWTAQTLPLWTPATNISDITNQQIGCDPFPDTTPNLGGYIVLMPAGLCEAGSRRIKNAERWGAKHILEYNNIAGTSADYFNLSNTEISIGMVSQDLGFEWLKLLLSGTKVDVNMVDQASAPVVLANIPNTRSGGYMSTFTSWGATWELAIKPQFSAPGRDILSTYPRALGSYAVDSGTSMAGPLVAAIYVLLMEATGIRDPAKLAGMLSATSKRLDYSDGVHTRVGLPAPVAQQGAGMVQVFEASRARTMFDVDSLAFNDTDHFVAERNFTIINLSNDTLEYRLNHTPAATAYTFDDDQALFPSEAGDAPPEPNIIPNELVSGHATLEFSPKSLSIPGGKKQVVSVRVTKPAGLDDGRMPVWSGWIDVMANGSKLSLPYQGVTGSMHDRRVLDINDTGVASTNDDALLLGPRTFLFPPAGKGTLPRWAYNLDTDQPTVVLSMALGSRLVRADLIPVNVPGANFNLTTILGTKTAGSLAGWPRKYLSRGDYEYVWYGNLENGSYVPEGVYKISIKALRIFGDPNKRSDYDETETLEFGIRYAEDV